MENHIMGIYYGMEEGPANLILSQEVSRRMAMENGGLTKENLNKVLYSPVLDIEKVKRLVKQAFDDDIKTLNIKSLDDADVEKLLEYITEGTLKEALENQRTRASEFLKKVNEELKKKKGKK